MTAKSESVPKAPDPKPAEPLPKPKAPETAPVPEIGGRGGLDPTRYGDWEIGGRCVDF